MATVANILTLANISSYLCVDDLEIKRWLKGGDRTQKNLPQLIYMVRKNVQWQYDQDPAESTLQQSANYLYSLCNKYVFEATQISGLGGGGTVISPTTSIGIASPLRITSTDFASATAWNDSRIVSTWNLQVFWNDTQRFLDPATEWTRTSTGITIDIPGFDSTTSTYTFYIFISI